VLPERADWQQLVGEAGQTLAEIAQVFAASTPSANEARRRELGLRR
jgi:hypothetical protein